MVFVLHGKWGRMVFHYTRGLFSFTESNEFGQFAQHTRKQGTAKSKHCAWLYVSAVFYKLNKKNITTVEFYLALVPLLRPVFFLRKLNCTGVFGEIMRETMHWGVANGQYLPLHGYIKSLFYQAQKVAEIQTLKQSTWSVLLVKPLTV